MSAAVLKQTTAIIAPDPFSGRKHIVSVPAGLTITQVVAQAIANDNLPPRWSAHYFRVYVGGEEVPPAWWARTRLKPGSHVAIITAPKGSGGGGKVFRTLLTVAVIALTAWVGAGGLVGMFGGFAGYTAGSVGAALAAAGVSIVGGVIINALAPTPGASDATASQAFSLQGAQNAAKPNQPYPVVLGRRRMVPPLAAATWTETVGDDVYLRMLLAWHTGPCALSGIKIGETPIDQYEGVEMQHRLMPGDTFPTLYNRIVREQPLQLALTHAVGWVQQTSQRKTTTISIDFGFPTGLLKNTSGGNQPATVQVQVQYRATGSGTWLNAPIGSGGTLTYTENKNAPFRRNITWNVTEGQYDIRIQRVTADDDSTALADDIYWVALRSLADGLPVRNDNLAITALRIKSSAQLNGVLDNLNAVVQMYAPKWDAESGTFGELGPTRNPGEIANWIALGPANARPLTDRVLTAQLGAWTERCTEKGWNCDHIIDNGSTVEQALQIVAGCGRGFGALWFDGQLAVAVDDEQPAAVQVFSARNVKNFTGTIAFPGALHAVNVNFADEDNGFQPATRTVFAPGYDDANATLFDTIDATGKTNGAEAWVVGWRYLNGRLLRPEVYEFDTNMQGLCVRIGQRADIAHYRMSVGICGARIRERTTNEDGDVTGFVLDETVTMEVGKSYVLRVQSASAISLLDLATVAGSSRTVTLATPLDPEIAPSVGDHSVFGIAGQETLPAIVIGIGTKAGKDGHITAIPYAPALLADGGDVPAWDPLITPRVLHGAALGVHVPGNDRVTNDNVIQAVNAERHDRAVGDQDNRDAIDTLNDYAIDIRSDLDAAQLVINDSVARLDTLVPKVTGTETAIRSLARDVEDNAESLLNLKVAWQNHAAATGSTLAYYNQQITQTFDEKMRAEVQARVDLAAVVQGLIGSGDTIGLAARITNLETATADLPDLRVSASKADLLDSQINTPGSGLAAQVSDNSAAIALLDPDNASATIKQTAVAARAQGLALDSMGETMLGILTAVQDNAKRIAATVAFVTTSITAQVTDGQSALAESIQQHVAVLQNADATLSATITTNNTASVTRDQALSDRTTALEVVINTPSTGLSALVSGHSTAIANLTTGKADASTVTALAAYFGAGIDGANTVASKLATEATARASGDGAASSRLDALEATVNTPGTGLSAVVTSNSAAISSLSSGKADASTVAALSATINTPGTGLSAVVGTHTSAIADLYTNKADASTVTILSSTVGGHTSSIASLLSVTGGFAAQWAVQIDGNGSLTGLVKLDASDSKSTFVVAANKFYFYDPSSGAQPLFSIVGGTAYFSAPIVANSITTDNLVTNAATKPMVVTGSPSGVSLTNSGWTTICSITDSFSGGKVSIAVTGDVTWSGSGPLVNMQVLRDGTDQVALGDSGGGTCPDHINVSGGGMDTGASAATHTYTLQAKFVGGSSNVKFNKAVLTLIDLKKT